MISKHTQCTLLELNRSSHYYQPVATSDKDIQIMDRIEQIHETISPCFGYRNIYQQLQQEGYNLGKNKVLKLMNSRGIKAIYPHKKINTSAKNNEHKIYKYLLKEFINNNNQIVAKYPNHIWSGDISYIKINGGYMYLAAVIDWHSRCILSWQLSNTMDATLATSVLQEAIDKYGTPEIFNSDQGSQYTSRAHNTLLSDNNITISMNGKGRSIDNIIIERFFRSIKYECVYINEYLSVKQLRKDIREYMHFYNANRFHSSLNYRKPQEVYLKMAAYIKWESICGFLCLKYWWHYPMHASLNRVRRRMIALGLYAVIKKKYQASPKSCVGTRYEANLLDQDLNTTAPNQKWISDITEMKVNARKLYLAVDVYRNR